MVMRMDHAQGVVLEFGPFRLYPAQRLLVEGNTACALGSRAIEILIYLVERAGEIVTKQELLSRAWPKIFVHEANLRVTVSGLRKALGDGQSGRRFIVNLAGQGYSFVAPVTRGDAESAPARPPQEAGRADNLPAVTAHVLGRAADIENVALQVPMRRCVTVLGPGGIGKTTMAIMAAKRLVPVYDDGVFFVDLSAVDEPSLIALAIASALGISLQTRGPEASLTFFLKDRRLLLVLDNCEHVIDAAAALVEKILASSSHVGILATSRETLRLPGEWVYRVPPLGVPQRAEGLTAAQALAFPAIELFVERASASLDDFVLLDADVPVVAEICRGLDGLPLAIELAAARIDIFGLRGLASVLGDPFLLMSKGPRGALPRQQSLLRTLEWSYKLLSAMEQSVLRRLSVFRGDFSIDAALAIAGQDDIPQEEVYSAILTLSAKSLLTSDISGSSPAHRLLHVTRSLVSHKLAETAEAAAIQRSHATYLGRFLAQAESDWDGMERAAWLAKYAGSIEDVRAAIDWCFSPEGDPALGIVLTVTALPLGFQLSLVNEFRVRVERALLHSRRIQPPQILAEMRLNLALGTITINTSGPAAGRTAAFDRGVQLSRQLDRLAYQAEPLIGLAMAHLNTGAYAAAAAAAAEASAIGERAGETMAVLAAERIAAQAEHFNGRHTLAATFAHRVIEKPAARLPLAYNLTPVDRRISMNIVLARIAWIQGDISQADTLIGQTIAAARDDGAFSLCPVLAHGAIPIAIWNGDDTRAADLTALLAEQANTYTLGFWANWAACFTTLLRDRDCAADAIPGLTDTLQLETFATLGQHLLTPEVVTRADGGLCGWCLPEIRRVQGEWLLREGSEAAAESLFLEAAELARAQGALAWELRAAISLGRLRKSQKRADEIRDPLERLLARFAPGTAPSDLDEAHVLLKKREIAVPVRRGRGQRQVRRKA